MIYGYSHISTSKQNHDSQIEVIQKYYPNCTNIYKDTGKGTENRKEWNKLKSLAKAGDTIVCEDVYRISGNVAEYKELFLNGVELVFINNSDADTEKYRQLLSENAEAFVTASKLQTGNPETDSIVHGMLTSIQNLTEKITIHNMEADIMLAFQKAKNPDMQAHRPSGEPHNTKKGLPYRTANFLQKRIKVMMYSQRFHVGSNNDRETANKLGIARKTVITISKQLLAEKGNMSDKQYLKCLQKELEDLKSNK